MTTTSTPEAAGSPPATARENVWSLKALQDYGIVLAFLVLFITLSATSGPFLTKVNLLNVIDQNAGIGIIACGVTLVIIAGGFDLSVGAIFALSGVVAAKIASSGSPALGIILGILCGAALGLANGAALRIFRVHSFIATLSTGYVFRGVAAILTAGSIVSVLNPSFSTLGSGSMLGVTYATWLFALVVVICGFLLQWTSFGRSVFAVGDNPEAARFSGISVDRIKALTFVLSGACAGLAGVLNTSRVATGQANSGVGLELTAIAAVVVGGTAITGGRGAIWRTVLGVWFLALIDNGFNLLEIDVFYQSIAQGVIILAAVGLDALSRRTA